MMKLRRVDNSEGRIPSTIINIYIQVVTIVCQSSTSVLQFFAQPCALASRQTTRQLAVQPGVSCRGIGQQFEHAVQHFIALAVGFGHSGHGENLVSGLCAACDPHTGFGDLKNLVGQKTPTSSITLQIASKERCAHLRKDMDNSPVRFSVARLCSNTNLNGVVGHSYNALANLACARFDTALKNQCPDRRLLRSRNKSDSGRHRWEGNAGKNDCARVSKF